MKDILLKVLFIIFAVPSIVLASQGEHHGSHGIETLTWYYINSAIFFTAMFFILRKPCKQFFMQRRDKIKNNIDEATRVYEEAVKALVAAKTKHEHLQEELDKITDGIIDEAQRQAEHITQLAEYKADYLRATAKQMIEAEEKKALKSLNTEFSKVLVEDVVNDIKSSLNVELDRKLISDGISKINGENLN